MRCYMSSLRFYIDEEKTNQIYPEEEPVNIITNGKGVKTGFKIDDKDVYVKRYSSDFKGTTATINYDLVNVKVVGISGFYSKDDIGYIFPLPTVRTGFTEYITDLFISDGKMYIQTAGGNRDGYTAYVYIFYVEK